VKRDEHRTGRGRGDRDGLPPARPRDRGGDQHRRDVDRRVDSLEDDEDADENGGRQPLVPDGHRECDDREREYGGLERRGAPDRERTREAQERQRAHTRGRSEIQPGQHAGRARDDADSRREADGLAD
jgi:hypothetical protein